MKTMYQYYLLDKSIVENYEGIINSEYKLQVIRPHKLNIHTILWIFFSLGKFREYRILYKSRIIAYAQIVPRIFIFNFMDKKKNGLHIGPCWTHTDFRGQGLYPYLLKRIITDYKNEIENFYIFTSIDNTASQRGIEKVGGTIIFYGYKDRLGIYRAGLPVNITEN
jgi:RimJ/RimL family protein N-acetyltransferase